MKDKELQSILKDEILRFYESIKPEAYHIDDAAYILQIKGAREITYFMQVMKELRNKGLLESNDGEYFKAPTSTTKMLEGVYKRYRNSYGFVQCENEADIFIPDEGRHTAMNNDIVSVKITKTGKGQKNPEGIIVNVIKRGNEKVVGTFERDRKFGFVVPDDERLGSDIYVDLNAIASMYSNIRSGARVLVKITRWPKTADRQPEGIIEKILGYEGTPGLDVNCIVAKNNLPFEFPEEVLIEANKVDLHIRCDKNRLDLRKETIITIDGEDAKDLDDAVSLHVLDNGNYQLGVHIADVSHYVRSNSALDNEAYNRGTSVYLVDRVIPMLPSVLSNGICSLNAHEDRYAMTCIMEITPQGKVIKSRIRPSIIHVQRRCNYNEVYKALSQHIIPEDLEPFMPLLRDLFDLYKILNAMRKRRGALDFDLPEYKVVVDDKGKPLRILKRERTFAERIIEECMLIANETVSSFLESKDNPSVYRIHELPKAEKLDNVKRVLRYLGKEIHIDEDNIHSRDYQKLLQEVEGTDIAGVAQTMILRSMQQACYHVDNVGHFGLASTSYTHFTSPIRRYPDLMVHRLLKKAIAWPSGYSKRDTSEEFLFKACEHSSKMEQIATETEREVDDLKKAQYMEAYIGHCFEAKVNSITSFGMFVEIDNGIDGLVSITSMNDDFYIFDEEHYILVGRHSNKEYHLGQVVQVTLVHVDVQKGQIDFVLGDIDPKDIPLRRTNTFSHRTSVTNQKFALRRKDKFKDGKKKTSFSTDKTSKKNKGSRNKKGKLKKQRKRFKK